VGAVAGTAVETLMIGIPAAESASFFAVTKALQLVRKWFNTFSSSLREIIPTT